MTEYEHEVHLIIKFKTERKIKSKAELKGIARELESSGLNATSKLRVFFASRCASVMKRNKVVQ